MIETMLPAISPEAVGALLYAIEAWPFRTRAEWTIHDPARPR